MDLSVVAVLLIIGVVVWFALRARPAAVFVVQIQNGAAVEKEGKVTQAFLNELTEQCLVAGIQSSEVRGLPSGSRIRLWFAKEFSPEAQQRLRNWWGVHGWRNGQLTSRKGPFPRHSG